MFSKPTMNNGKKVELKAMNIHQKWIRPMVGLSIFPVIFGSQ